MGVLLLARTEWPPPPGVVAAGGDSQQLAHAANVVVGLLSIDELERRYRVEPVSLTKEGGGFFRISRFSRRRRTSSWRSSLVRPSLRRPASRSLCLCQFLSDSPVMPRFWATSVMSRPPSRTSRTASARNSGG